MLDFSPEANPFTVKARAQEADERRSEGFTVIGVKLIASAEIKDTAGERYEVRTDVEPGDWFTVSSGYRDTDDEPESSIDREALMASARQGLGEAISILTSHFARLGFVRCDGFWNAASRDHGPEEPASDESTPIVWGVARAGDGVELENLARVRTELGKRSGLSNVVVETEVSSHFYPSRVFDQMQEFTGPFRSLWFDETATPDLEPLPGEDCGDWLERVAIPPDELGRRNDRWERSGRDVELFAMCGNATEQAAGGKGIEWVVPGLIPRGVVTLLVGSKGSGKSTLVSELAAKLESMLDEPRSFLGSTLSGSFLTATFTAEDPIAIHAEREKFFRPVFGDLQGWIIDCARCSFAQCLAQIRRLPSIDLVVFDPVRAFLVGDEDSSDATNRFYSELTSIAREKNCAVLAVHHLKKGSPPKRLKDLDAAVRGSGVHMDRARVVIGMIQHATGAIEVGIIKHNIPHSTPMLAPLNEGRFFSRGAGTLTLEPILVANGAEPPALDEADPTDTDSRVAAAIETLSAKGITVRRTGNSSLFKLTVTDLKGMSRRTIDRSVARLVAKGNLEDTDDGLILIMAIGQ